MDVRQFCGTSERRQAVVASTKLVGGLRLNGIDYIEVLDDDAPSEDWRQKLIDVTFLRPDGVAALTAENFAIVGGVRITDVNVIGIAPGADPETVRLTLNRPGDFSRYLLQLKGANSDTPPPHFDPVLSSVEFSFKADCPTDFDCLPPNTGGEPRPPSPAIDYLAKDYESFRHLMLDRMAVTIPAWKERSPADLGITLVEVLAHGADLASYYQDAVATEAYLSRARLRASARRHARLLGYAPGEGCNARTFVALKAAQGINVAAAKSVSAGAMLLTAPEAEKGLGVLPPALRPIPDRIAEILRAGVRVFETMESARLIEARNEMLFHTWSSASCCLAKGATSAFVVGTLAATDLDAGDVVILEERIPLGGTNADPPDPAHRHAVRLDRRPKELIDRVGPVDVTVLELTWYLADALPFSLNLTPDGHHAAAVCHGNVVLADDGRTFDYDFANSRPRTVAEASLHAELIGRSALNPDRWESDDGRTDLSPFRPSLTVGPVTRSVPYDPLSARLRPARDALTQDAQRALPAISLLGDGETWTPQADLLNSDRFAPEFVVETHNDGHAELRFGDDRFGRAPAADRTYRARLRIGNGAEGRIGANAIGHIVTDDPDLIAGVTNPIAAWGGVDPETLTAIKLNAPQAFRKQKRAVTADDYARFAERHPDVQRAVAERRWTGSWQTMFIAVDRRGGRPVDAQFETDMRTFLEPFRLAGHDVEIEPPSFVPLDVALVVCVAHGHYAEHVEAALLDRFSSGTQADGSLGFFHPDAFSFGQKVMLSPIIAAAMAVPGVRWVGMALEGFAPTGRFRQLDDQSRDYAEDGVITVGRRQVARLDNDANAPEMGRLRFYMEGGR